MSLPSPPRGVGCRQEVTDPAALGLGRHQDALVDILTTQPGASSWCHSCLLTLSPQEVYAVAFVLWLLLPSLLSCAVAAIALSGEVADGHPSTDSESCGTSV